MPQTLLGLLPVIGLILLGGTFVWAGVFHFLNFRMVAAMLKGRRWPAPAPLLAVASAFQIVAGGCLIVGLFVQPAALGLAAFTVVASLTLLDFWRQTGEARQAAFNGFVTNCAVLGGLLVATSLS